MTIIHSKNYSFRKNWELFIQKIIQLEKNYSKKYSFKKFENYSFKKNIHFFEKLIIAQGYVDYNYHELDADDVEAEHVSDCRYGAAQAPACKTVYEEECQTVQEIFHDPLNLFPKVP